MPATPNPVVTDTASLYTKYTILKGAHYCDKSMLKEFTGDHISFSVKFDSTAIYKTADPLNQEDINKLYGFSEGIDNHLNSARIGWNWNRNALRLYAYVYANGIRTSKEISKVAIGATISATIRVAGKEYLFSVDENNVALPRALNDSLVSGYRQYPYFGGDEIAPHNIYVYIRDM
ncbi:MAG: hypothetical protein JWP81_5350 [Ferruginibacter sp.]|nr:hypothetical protein [Ferruginibacter sp.]